jgi:chromate transporter
MKPRSLTGSAEVFLVFLRLGCTSFGGPIAHLGYFQREIVERRRWCSEAAFAEIVALAQSLPGPASSQTGFALGILRAGWLGGVAAWVGFTLPSALLMLAFAYGHSLLTGGTGVSLLHGLQIVAVAVVAQAVLTMQRSLAPDRLRIAFAIVAACLILFGPSHFATLIAILAGAIAGLLFCRAHAMEEQEYIELPISKSAGKAAAVLFSVVLALSVFALRATGHPALRVFSAFYRSGALVFGGGHVVLPLLENAVVAPGWVTQQSFLAGYGAAQALPGPLFTFAAYLGAVVRPATRPLLYGMLGLMGIFMPGLLAMAALLPFWGALRTNLRVRAGLQGINASVVGILAAALVRPLWTSTIHTTGDFGFAVLAFALLALWKVQPWMVVAGMAAAYVFAVKII